MKTLLIPTLLLAVGLSLTALTGCGNDQTAPSTTNAQTVATEGTLSPEQLTNGVGPITEVTLGELDAALAAKGDEVFTTKCSACHKLDQRYVGPELGTVLSRRTPAYIMNMMLNPEGMLKEHPAAKELLAQFMTQMPNQHLTQDDARAVLEYLRAHQTDADEAGEDAGEHSETAETE
jgi:cytochrome c1